jgi:hypothetical protein
MSESDTQMIKPCPACGGEGYDKRFGITCRRCGLWIGNGTKALELGGYVAVWNGDAKKGKRE